MTAFVVANTPAEKTCNGPNCKVTYEPVIKTQKGGDTNGKESIGQEVKTESGAVSG
jgi:hypothetical protein